MKIIIANYRYFIAGGPERYMFKFIDTAKEHGDECIPFSVDYAMNEKTPYSKYFITPRGNREDLFFSNIKLTPKNIIKMLNCTIYNFEAEKKMRKLIRDVNPDVIYVLQEINALSPSIINAAKKENVRVVHRISDFFMFCPKSDFLNGNQICEKCIQGNYCNAIKNRCVKNSMYATLVRVFAMKLYSRIRIFEKVDAYITTCQFTRKKMILGGVPAEKIICIPTFIDSSKINPCYSNEGYFLYLGRVVEQKGVIYAVEAMRYLKEKGIKLKITGELDESEESKKVSAVIKKYDLNDCVEFVGFQGGKALEHIIQNSIAVINPAIWYENMPNTVIEAYAFGKPVVASRIGSLAEIVEDNYSGLLFEMGNSKDLSLKLQKLIDNPELAVKLGHQARKLCEDKYNVEKHYRSVMDVLTSKN